MYLNEEYCARNVFIDGGGSGDDEESVPLLVYVVAVEIDNDKGRPETICWCFDVQIESYPLSRGGFAKTFNMKRSIKKTRRSIRGGMTTEGIDERYGEGG